MFRNIWVQNPTIAPDLLSIIIIWNKINKIGNETSYGRYYGGEGEYEETGDFLHTQIMDQNSKAPV